MRRDLRPHSARLKQPTQNNFLSNQPMLFDKNTPQDKAKPDKPTHQSARSTHPLNHPESPPQIHYQLKPSYSHNKILKKYSIIRAHKDIKHAQEEQKTPHSVTKMTDIIKKKIQTAPYHLKLNINHLTDQQPKYPEFKSKEANHHLEKKKLQPRSPQQGFEQVQLPKVLEEDLILSKQEQKPSIQYFGKSPKESQIAQQIETTAYWKSQNKFVSLFPIQKCQNLNYQHDHILPIYAQVTINNHRYVISDEYKNCSLKHLLEEFGPFPEQLTKRYLKEIALGLHHLHFHKRSHNQLNTRTVLYNKEGNIFINMLRAASIYHNKEDLINNKMLYWQSPESIGPKMSRSFKNDIWALGCLAIQLMTQGLTTSPLHPYNFKTFKNIKEETMIDNIKQRYSGCFTEQAKKLSTTQQPTHTKIKLSQQAKNFIEYCLEILQERRPEMEAMLEHQFFDGV